MPLYDFECDCGNEHVDVYLSISEHDGWSEICECGLIMRQVLTAPKDVGFEPYYDIALGARIESRADIWRYKRLRNCDYKGTRGEGELTGASPKMLRDAEELLRRK